MIIDIDIEKEYLKKDVVSRENLSKDKFYHTTKNNKIVVLIKKTIVLM